MAQLVPAMPWRKGTPINVLDTQHAIPKNASQNITQFKADGTGTTEEHINLYKEAMARLNVTHEDVACRLFSFSLDDQALEWYVTIPHGSIISWDQLQATFYSQFRMHVDPYVSYHQFA